MAKIGFFKSENEMRLKLFSSAVLVIIICSFGGQALYLSAKAQLAQYLLQHAWQSASQTPSHTPSHTPTAKPWPWADIEPVAKLHVPRLALQQVVLNHHHSEAMAFGPGLEQSNGGFVLAGHRDSHFRFLADLKTNDRVILEMRNQQLHHYRIADTLIIDTREQNHLSPPEGSLVLITCYPFDQLSAGGPLRYAVIAIPESAATHPPLNNAYTAR